MEFNKGDRVTVPERVVVYLGPSRHPGWSEVRYPAAPDGHDGHGIAQTEGLVLVERNWQPGDLVMDQVGVIYERCKRTEHCWHAGGFDNDPKGQRNPVGRLTRLVPEATDGR